ncbi:uncharacterized protein LOC123411834 isoform X2 [Hordeum vulgare subsp. vulgare]|uniref:uncharacterized protein LOC123411834 isoform X2 n=1 Tax=Hordeum vulgare subsp. vulgare TaxID=112509 RepID=UPI00162E4590|nr:uncharacterized protein LOC123411834 isoform X2 [Hordeum vulgare subsp. vulgare]
MLKTTRGVKMTRMRVRKKTSLLRTPSHDPSIRHDPVATPSNTLVSSTRNVKRDRAVATGSAEKAAKQPKPDAPKPRKALPQMRIAVPVASTDPTSVTSPAGDEEDPMDLDAVDMPVSQQATDVILLDDDEELLRSTAELTKTIPEAPVSSAPPAGSTALTTTPPTGSIVVTTVPTAPPPSALAYSLQRVPEDQTGAAKEAMIQAEHMMQRTREAYEASKLAYDASSTLQANVRGPWIGEESS